MSDAKKYVDVKIIYEKLETLKREQNVYVCRYSQDKLWVVTRSNKSKVAPRDEP